MNEKFHSEYVDIIYACPLCKEIHYWSNICIEMLDECGIFDWIDEGFGENLSPSSQILLT